MFVGIKIIFPILPNYQMPQVFQSNWAPKMMPQTNMQLTNTFANFNMEAMGGGGGYPGMWLFHSNIIKWDLRFYY